MDAILITFVLGMIVGLALGFVWRRWKEKILDAVIELAMWLSIISIPGIFTVLIYGKSSANPAYAPENSIFWLTLLIFVCLSALFFGFLRWKRSQVAIRKWRKSVRERFRVEMD